MSPPTSETQQAIDSLSYRELQQKAGELGLKRSGCGPKEQSWYKAWDGCGIAVAPAGLLSGCLFAVCSGRPRSSSIASTWPWRRLRAE